MSLKTPPVLLLVFRRADATRQVFETLRKARPEKLFVAGDGPRPHRPGEAEQCQITRRIATAVDWPCEVKTLFRNENLGCGRAVSSALRWFFDQVEEGIVLEDDCLPDASFFPYCAELLARYRHDTRVMHISGYNPLPHGYGDGSYYYSRLMQCWGWASWRRVAQHFDYDLNTFPAFKQNRLIESVFQQRLKRRYWIKTLDRYHQGRVNAWAHRWSYMIFSQNGLCINPGQNLIRNIGFGVDSTFANNPWSYHGRRQTGPMESIRHPTFMLPYPGEPDLAVRYSYGIWWPRMMAVWGATRVVNLVNRVLKPFGRRIF